MSPTESARAGIELVARVHEQLGPSARDLAGAAESLLERARGEDLAAFLPDLEKLCGGAGLLRRMVERPGGPDGPAMAAGADPAGFAAKLRHDLRTPINAVKGYGELLLEDAEAGQPELAAALAGILDQAHRLLDLIDRAARIPEAGAAPEPAELAAAGASAAEIARPALTGRILVVDDDERNRELLERHLQRDGHLVTAAADGPAALALLRGRPFDLVLLDLVMPGMDGQEVLRRIKSAEGSAGGAVIMISALHEIATVARCIEAGAEDYLGKPFEPALLRARIGAALDKKRLRDLEREAVQAARLATVGQLASGIAHEMNTPLQYMGDNLEYVAEGVEALCAALTDPAGRPIAPARLATLCRELPLALAAAADGTAQIGRIVASMKEFSQPGVDGLGEVDLNRAIETTLTVSRHAWKDWADIERDFDPGLCPILAHAAGINQVILSLVLNAVQAIQASGRPPPGRIAIATRREGQAVAMVIADSGTGVPAAIRERIFDPFFTTREVGRGLGQGLTLSRDIVRKHGGTIAVGGEEGEGAVFTVRLPAEPRPIRP